MTPAKTIPGQQSGDQPPGRRPGLFSRKRWPRWLARRMIFLATTLLAAFFGGFLWFADAVTALKAPDGVKADAIVVLTGGYLRIEQALGLLRDGSGRRLLISGAHPATSPGEIRRVTQASRDLFACCVDIGYDAIDTIGNASEISRWIRDNGYGSVLVVTNNYHMPRSLHELRRAAPQTRFIAYPVVNSDLTRRSWFTEPDVMRIMLAEYSKLVLAHLRDLIGIHQGSGLRTEKDRDVKTAF